MSPYEFNEISEKEEFYGLDEIRKVGNYNYYTYVEDKEEFIKKDFKTEDCIIIVSEQFHNVAEEFKKNYREYIYEDLHIFVNTTMSGILKPKLFSKL